MKCPLRFQFFQWLTLWSWKNYFTFLCIRYSNYKIGIIPQLLMFFFLFSKELNPTLSRSQCLLSFPGLLVYVRHLKNIQFFQYGLQVTTWTILSISTLQNFQYCLLPSPIIQVTIHPRLPGWSWCASIPQGFILVHYLPCCCCCC